MDIVAFYIDNCLQAGKAAVEVSTVWNLILRLTFKMEDRFLVSPETCFARHDHFALYLTPRESGLVEVTFMFVECHALGREGLHASWRTATDNLKDYLKRLPSNPGGLWGAIAVGKYVQFYVWSDGCLSMMTDDPLRLDRQCRTIQNILNDIESRAKND